MKSPRLFAYCLFAALTARNVPATEVESLLPRRAPNIILIVADDLGYCDLGAYGQSKITTPRLDRMAAEGVRCTQVYAGAPVCAPSRCVLMTGLHAGHAFIRENSPAVGGQAESYGDRRQRRLSLRKSDRVVAEWLQSSGYRTAIAGKWGLAEPHTEGTPPKKGFDESLVYLNQNHAADHFTDHLWKNDQRYDVQANRDGRRVVYAEDLFTEFALDFITRHRDRRFFLYLPYTAPHKKWETPDRGAYAAQDWPENAKNFAAMVSRLDGDVGHILDRLKQLKIDDDTIVFFTSDNGEDPKEAPWANLFESSGTLRGKKGSVYEGGVRVPMIVRWPGKITAGALSDEAWSFADFLPTAAELAGLPTIPAIDGASVLPILDGRQSQLHPRHLYWELPGGDRFRQAARLGKWKAVRNGRGQPLELYDLKSDPSETTNVASMQPTVRDSLNSYLNAAHTDSPHWPVALPATAP